MTEFATWMLIVLATVCSPDKKCQRNVYQYYGLPTEATCNSTKDALIELFGKRTKALCFGVK